MTSLPQRRLTEVQRGRLCIFVAALLWSTGGGFSKVLTQENALGLHVPTLTPLQIAFYRGLFAGLILVPGLRRRDCSFRPQMVPMVIIFALMSATYVSAQVLGTAANAILLQYTAPMWMLLASVWLLGERLQWRSLGPVLVGLLGVVVIVLGGPPEGLSVVGLGLASGITYAAVVIFLRVLRDESSRWLAVLNLLGTAVALLPWVVDRGLPSVPQLAVLAAYGAVQMGLPYWLMGRGMRTVSPQEAGTITLVEPLLNPVWAFLLVGEVPAAATLLGGTFILGALVWRYWPLGSESKVSPTDPPAGAEPARAETELET